MDCRLGVLAAALLWMFSASPSDAGAPPPHGADVIFLLDGSGSVSRPAFELQIEAIRSCLCGPGAPLAADGSVAVGVAQFSDFARVDIPLTVLKNQASAEAFCSQLAMIDQIGSSTRMLPGVGVVESMFDEAPDGTARSLIILTDSVLFDFSLRQVENACEDLRDDRFPVRICAAITDEDTGFRMGLFRNICNTPDAATFDPSEPIGSLIRLEQLSEFQPMCADCVVGCFQGGGPDCDADGIPDQCEIDCDLNGIPDDCDITANPERDRNNNGELDDCEEDCNGNGIADFIDLEDGNSTDCNENNIPDECDGAQDCNGNGVPDFCELDEGLAVDCNINGIPDECEDALFSVVTLRTLAIEGDEPDIGFPTSPFAPLALGTAVHDSGRVYFGDLGDLGGPILLAVDRGDSERHDGRIFEFDVNTGVYRRILREGDIVQGGSAWLNEPPAECADLEAFLYRLAPDKPLPGYTSSDGAIRGVAQDGSLLISAAVYVDSALCGVIDTVAGLLRLDQTGASPLFREELDVCLLEEGRIAGPARPRSTGVYAQPEVQLSETDFAWLISQTDDGGCAVIRDGQPSPDGGLYIGADFGAGDRPYKVTARHMEAGQTLFFAETSASTGVLVLDEEGSQTLVARTGTTADLPGNPSAVLALRSSQEEGADIGVFRGEGPDVVFRGRTAGIDTIFLWEREHNPADTPSSANVEPIVLADDIEAVRGVSAVRGSIRLSYPTLGGPCEGCDPAVGVLIFKATWTEPQTKDSAGGLRQGLFVYSETDGITPIALPGMPLPPPHESMFFAIEGDMLEDLDIDINQKGLVSFGALVVSPPTKDDPDPALLHAAMIASVKPSRCDLAPPFGTHDLADIVRFVTGLSSGNPAADLARPFGTFDLADIVAFVTCFDHGCH